MKITKRIAKEVHNEKVTELRKQYEMLFETLRRNIQLGEERISDLEREIVRLKAEIERLKR